jgi:hypothetical protein
MLVRNKSGSKIVEVMGRVAENGLMSYFREKLFPVLGWSGKLLSS